MSPEAERALAQLEDDLRACEVALRSVRGRLEALKEALGSP